MLGIMLVAASAEASHSTFQNGDVIAGGQTISQVLSFGRFDWFLSDGTLNQRMALTVDDFPEDFAFDHAGRLYSVTSYAVRVFDPTGRLIGTFGQFQAFTISSMTFDAAGNAYVAANGPGHNVVKVDATGSFVRQFSVPAENIGGPGISSMDLGSDQCTLYYTSLHRILRYDVCNDRPMPDLNASLPGSAAKGVRLLPDGGVIVAGLEAIYRLNSVGTVTQTYDVPNQDQWLAVALDADQRSFWATSRDMAFKFDIASGALLNPSIQASDYLFTAIAVVGEPRAATLGLAAIPGMSDWILVALAISLGAAGVMRLRILS
jgi:hypothetical protein